MVLKHPMGPSNSSITTSSQRRWIIWGGCVALGGKAGICSKWRRVQMFQFSGVNPTGLWRWRHGGTLHWNEALWTHNWSLWSLSSCQFYSRRSSNENWLYLAVTTYKGIPIIHRIHESTKCRNCQVPDVLTYLPKNSTPGTLFYFLNPLALFQAPGVCIFVKKFGQTWILNPIFQKLLTSSSMVAPELSRQC